MIKENTFGSPKTGASVTVAYTGTAGTTAAVVSGGAVRVVSTTDCFIEISESTVGTAAVANTGLYLPAFVPEYFQAPTSAKVSAIQVGSAGSIYVTPFN